MYPAANAYTASEPGQLTKPLSEMNNFVTDSNCPFPTDVLPYTRNKMIQPKHNKVVILANTIPIVVVAEEEEEEVFILLLLLLLLFRICLLDVVAWQLK